MSVQIAIGVGQPVIRQGFTVEYVHSCMILRGPVPADVFTALASTMPKGAMLCSRLAKRYDASFVAGLPDDLERLSATAPLMPLPAGSERLPADAITWLQKGERGSSSEAMFDAAFGGHFATSHDGATATPGDVSDFVRCRLLAEQVTHVANHLDRVAQISPAWGRIVSAWPQLCESLDREVADYRSGAYAAPHTEALLEFVCWSDKL